MTSPFGMVTMSQNQNTQDCEERMFQGNEENDLCDEFLANNINLEEYSGMPTKKKKIYICIFIIFFKSSLCIRH